MHRVIINGKTKYAEDGILLSDMLSGHGIYFEHPCGGKGLCQKCTVYVNDSRVLSCRYEIRSDIVVCVPEKSEIISETGANETGRITEKLCYALDIGTTTLALALVSLDENKIIKVITRTNPQRAYGADVITRIDYCSKNGVEELNKALISEINSMIAEFGLNEIEMLYASGNATMLHLFFGIDCSSMGTAPYTPAFLESKTEKAVALGITGVDTVESLPSVAAFVGADLVAGLNYVGMPEKGKYSFLVDLGTNAEIILFSGDAVLCTAAAAGPCFEGSNISCGMSATEGAVYSYSDSEIKTVGDAPAKGICGTGLIDIVSQLIEKEAVDETGFMKDKSFEISDGVYINQADIRQYQLAKSAVYSAILTLTEIKNISFDDVDKMYISGGFSAKINIANAVRTGLLPEELIQKCSAINNSSLLGTVKYACEKNDLAIYIDKSAYVDLSANQIFSDLFIENMMFEVN